MHWKRLFLTLLFLILAFTLVQSKEDKKLPRYYKSSFSKRFVKQIPKSNSFITEFRAELPETLRILALRVEFQPDNDRATTGNGLFDLSEPDSIMINSPPHDRDYFINQLKALKHYYESVSRGKLSLKISDESGNFFVYPLQTDSAWTLPHEMAYYNPNSGEEALDKGLAELFRDAIQAADQSGYLDFAKFDVFIIFHAGVGWEFSQEFDTTPSDIPSVFLNLNDLRKNIGNNDPSFQGIAVNDGGFYVTEGIILPETESQGGVEIAMLGTEVIMLGHQLGLPNLFDTDTGRPGIGRFGIMDQGSGSFSGFIPVQPCAWSKIFLGWEQPITIYSGENIPVAAPLASNPNKIYKIPINAREYFLIENRQRNVLKSRTIAVGFDQYGNRIEFNDDGDILLPSGIQKLGVVTEIDEYDFGLPGSGIVIWHIDEKVIEERFAENRVNVDMHHRGVDVVEADGAQDIGYFYNFFGITGFNAGGAYDFWWSKNEDHLWANQSETVQFTPTSMPNSNAYSGAKTGIYVTNFSDLDSVMTFSLEIKRFREGFPIFLGKNSGMSSIVAADLDGDGAKEMIATTQTGKILAWHSDGTSFFQNDEKTDIIKLNGDTIQIPLPVFSSAGDVAFPFPATVSDLDGNGIAEVSATSSSGEFYLWNARDGDNDGYADLLLQMSISSDFSVPPLVSKNLEFQFLSGTKDGKIFGLNYIENRFTTKAIANDAIVGLADLSPFGVNDLILVSETGEVFRVNESFEITWQTNLSTSGKFQPPAIADIDNDDKFEIILGTTAGEVFVLNEDGTSAQQFEKINVGSPLSSPAIADLNYDGYPDIILVGGGKIFAFQHNATPVTNFPMTFERNNELSHYPTPVIADIDNDHYPEIFVARKSGDIAAFTYNGENIEEFPLSVSDTTAALVSICTLDGDKFNLIARSGDHYAYVWELDYEFDQNLLLWGNYLKDESHNPVFASSSPANPTTGEKLLPEKKVYNYPNPTQGSETYIRYYLRDDAEVKIRIYDASGEFVEEIQGPGVGGIDNEVVWGLGSVQSGVYLARISAKNGSRSESVIIKIAVMK